MLTSVGKGWEGVLSQAEDLPSGMWKGRDVLEQPYRWLKANFFFLYVLNRCLHSATCRLGLNWQKTTILCDEAGLGRTSLAAVQPVSRSHPMSVQLSRGTCPSVCVPLYTPRTIFPQKYSSLLDFSHLAWMATLLDTAPSRFLVELLGLVCSC